jgi:hypothetical protein
VVSKANYLAAPKTRDLLDAFQPAAPSQPKVRVKSRVADARYDDHLATLSQSTKESKNGKKTR